MKTAKGSRGSRLPTISGRKRKLKSTNSAVIHKGKTHLLVLDRDEPKKELEFEVEYQLSLTPAQRYEIMDRLVRDGLSFIKRHGYQEAPAIVTRS